jgi:hypothetical protein
MTDGRAIWRLRKIVDDIFSIVMAFSMRMMVSGIKRQMIRCIGCIIWNSTLMYFNNIEEILIQEL